jgi:hypothetical protein
MSVSPVSHARPSLPPQAARNEAPAPKPEKTEPVRQALSPLPTNKNEYARAQNVENRDSRDIRENRDNRDHQEPKSKGHHVDVKA